MDYLCQTEFTQGRMPSENHIFSEEEVEKSYQMTSKLES